MMIIERCIELKLPTPRGFDTEPSYLITCIQSGHTINTRICRYIGIGNLHSVKPVLRKMKVPFTEVMGRAFCPTRGVIPPEPVLHIYMDAEQQQDYLLDKKLAPTKR